MSVVTILKWIDYMYFKNRKKINNVKSESEIIYISRALNIDYIEKNIVDNSSKIFEDGLVRSLASRRNISILYLGDKNIKKITKNNINFYSLNYRSVLGLCRVFYFLYKHRRINSKIITSGYNLNLNIALISSRIFGYKIFSYVYDTHKIAVKNMGRIKKFILNLYFSIGFWTLNYFNGLLVLNDLFLKDKNSVNSYLKTKIGYLDVINKSNDFFIDSEKIIITFAGTINDENGISIIIDCLQDNNNNNLQFDFYGSGNALSRLLKYSESDPRVCYKGNTSIEELYNVFHSSDYLINLRDPNSISCLYSFPSKLIQFMGSGTPVISNFFPGLNDYYRKYLINVSCFSGEGLNKVLNDLPSSSESFLLGNKSRIFILKNNNWNAIVSDLLEYIEF